MNYRHAFHAGNHADLLKHVVLVWMTVLGYVSQKSTVMLTEAPRSATDLGKTAGGRGLPRLPVLPQSHSSSGSTLPIGGCL